MAKLGDELRSLLGADRVRAPKGDETGIAPLVVEPGTEAEIVELVRKCERDRLTLAALGAGRTLALMRRTPVEVAVSLVRLNRIVAYEPDDMTLVCEAGATLDVIAAAAGAHRQRLPVDPPNPAQVTMGALIAGAKSGPLRLSEGTIRDLLIGIRFVGHEGRIVHAGGRVVKNVAGYDLMKVMTGSFGTLGIIIEAALKIRPIPPIYELITAQFSSSIEAFGAVDRCEAAAPPAHCEVLSAGLNGGKDFALYAGICGIESEVEQSRAALCAALGPGASTLREAAAQNAYQELRDSAPDYPALAAQVALPRVELAGFLDESRAEFRAHALSGVAQLYQRDCASVDAARSTLERWRERAHGARGNLRVIGVRADLRDGLELFDTPARAAFGLMRRLKQTFDPYNIFNPECFVGGL